MKSVLSRQTLREERWYRMGAFVILPAFCLQCAEPQAATRATAFGIAERVAATAQRQAHNTHSPALRPIP